MGRSSRRKWRSGRSLPVKSTAVRVERDVEQWEYGPFSAVRTGRYVEMRSHWDPEEHQEFMRTLKADRPNLKKEIDDHIATLRDHIRHLDRLELLGAVSTALQVSNEENFGESSPARFSHAEYFLALCLAEPLDIAPVTPTSEDVQVCIDAIDEIKQKVAHYYGTEIAEKGDQGAITELRFLMQLHTLNVRGDAYPQHMEALSLKLLRGVEPFIQKHFSYDAEQVWEKFVKVVQSVQDQIRRHAKDALDPIFRSHSAYGKWLDRQNLKRFQSTDDVRHAFFESGLAPTPEQTQKFQEYMELFGGAAGFEYTPNDECERKLIDHLSTEFGSNNEFTSVKNWSAWPLNPSVIYDFPIVRHQGRYFAFGAPRLLSDSPHIIERLINRIDPDFYNSTYLEKRGKVLEQYTMDLLVGALRPNTMGSSLYYTPPGQGRTELDGLLVVDDALVIMEAKAGHISEAARRGAPRGLREDVEDTIGAAFSQGQRALSYIDSAPEVAFYGADGSEVLRIRGTDFRHRFVVTVTMSPLYVLGTALPKLKDIGAISGRDWPWAVYICDLAAIAELTTHPAMLLHYMQRRLAANKPALSSIDELDLFGHFLSSGLYFEEGVLDRPNTRISFTGYTEKIDDYFYYRAGIKTKAVKPPQQKLPESFEMLVSKLEALRPKGWVTATLALLDWDSPTREALSKTIRSAENKFVRDGQPHSYTLTTDDMALILVVGPKLPTDSGFTSWSEKWCEKGKSRRYMLAWVGRLKRTREMSFWTAGK